MPFRRSARALLAVVLLGLVLVPATLTARSSAAATNTVVSLTFDDGSESQYSTLTMLQSRGLRGTFYINSALVGSSAYYMNWSQVQGLADAGNEIGGHTLNHTDLTTVSQSTAQHEVCDDRQALLARGFSPVASFAYPYAANNATAEQVVRDCGYSSARDVGGIVSGSVCSGCPYAETIPPRNAFDLATPEPAVESTTLAELQNYVTQAENNGGGWVIITFHGICSNQCTGSNSLNPAVFVSFLDWLQPRAAAGTEVQPIGAVMGASVPPPTPVPPTTTIGCNGAPCTNAWYRTGSVQVTLTATDPDGSAVLETRYTTDGSDPATSPTSSSYTGPFSITRTTTVRFGSQDVDGHVEAPKTQVLQIDGALPTVSLTSPSAGATYARGAGIPLSANAADAGSGGGAPSGVARVAFFDGATPIGTVTTAPYQTTWPTKKNTKTGNHTLTAVVTDVAGNSTTSTPVTITVTQR